jgi:hypothetical protein
MRNLLGLNYKVIPPLARYKSSTDHRTLISLTGVGSGEGVGSDVVLVLL